MQIKFLILVISFLAFSCAKKDKGNIYYFPDSDDHGVKIWKYGFRISDSTINREKSYEISANWIEGDCRSIIFNKIGSTKNVSKKRLDSINPITERLNFYYLERNLEDTLYFIEKINQKFVMTKVEEDIHACE